MPTLRVVSCQNFDTPRETRLLTLPQAALRAREARVQQLKALVEAGMYKVDSGSLARAILRAGRSAAALTRAPARSLDMRVSA